MSNASSAAAAGPKGREKAARKAERERRRRVARDERAERARAARSGFANVANPRRSALLTLVCAVFAVYCLFPFFYLLVNATKTQADFTSTFGLGFGKTFALWDNVVTVFTYDGGIFGRWFLNTVLYVVAGAGGATLLAIMGGYGLAKFRFPGRRAVFVVVIGAISVPGIALAVPQFLLFAKLNLTNTPWATIVATWNNYFLPLIMLKDSDWYPLTIGLNQWKDQASTAGGQAIQNLVITGSLVTIVPLVIAFLCLQRYWQSGLSAGAVKE